MQVPPQLNDYGEQQRVAVLMEMNFKRLFKELQEVRQMVEQLKQSPVAIRGAPVPDPPVQIVQQRESAVESPRQELPPRGPPVQQNFQQAPPPAEKKPYSQRVGEWKPEDVSIEKFFYAGSGGRR